eukprot:4868122-Amphidinium_carterae.1
MALKPGFMPRKPAPSGLSISTMSSIAVIPIAYCIQGESSDSAVAWNLVGHQAKSRIIMHETQLEQTTWAAKCNAISEQ